MDLKKILSDSPPQKRAHLSFPPFRFRLTQKHNPNPTEIEAAEWMLALSSYPPTSNHNNNPNGHTEDSHLHPPAGSFHFTSSTTPNSNLSFTPSIRPGSNHMGPNPNHHHHFSMSMTETALPVGTTTAAARLHTTAVVTPPHNLAAAAAAQEETRKFRRVNTTKRLSASPSGKPCPNCGVEASTLWRTCKLQSGSAYLCNACGLRYKKGKFCPLCYRVYYDVDTNQLQWKQCLNCLNWTHKICLEQRKLINNSPYLCINCKRHIE